MGNIRSYNYYSSSHASSPGLCVLLRGCPRMVAGPCPGCQLGPRACAGERDRANTTQCRYQGMGEMVNNNIYIIFTYVSITLSFLSFALWSTTQNTSVLITGPATSRVSLVSGEVGCQREVRKYRNTRYHGYSIYEGASGCRGRWRRLHTLQGGRR